MAKRKFPDITKFEGLPWSKVAGEQPIVDDVETCTFCGKGIKETENHYLLYEIGGSNIDPALVSCAKCSVSAGLEW